MKTKNIIFGLLLIFSFNLFGQDYLFRVIATKGNIKFSASNSWKDAKAGDKLKKGEKVKVENGGYLSLIHVSGKPLELKNSGTFEADKLAKKFASGPSNLASRYAEFLLSEVKNKDGEKSYNTTGAVHRDYSEHAIKLHMTNNTSIAKGIPFNVYWDINKENKDKDLKLVVSNSEGTEIYSTDAKGNSATIDLSAIKLEEVHYFLKIVSKDDKKITSDKFHIVVIDAKKEKEIKSELSELEIDVTSALSNMLAGVFYEKQGLVLNAIESYKKAIEITPHMEDYKKIYSKFLIKNNITTEEEASK